MDAGLYYDDILAKLLETWDSGPIGLDFAPRLSSYL